jgi:hypothetical protein
METQYRYSTDGSSWTNLDTIVSSCAGVTTSLGSCSASQTQTPSITLFSGADSTVSVFFRVEYSTDSGSSWTQLNDDEEVTTNSSETFSCLQHLQMARRYSGDIVQENLLGHTIVHHG